MATPFLAGIAIAAAALAGRYGILAWHTFKTRPPKPRMRKFYDGGFQPTMTKREAALILGIRERYWLPTILMLVVAIIRLLKSMKLKM